MKCRELVSLRKHVKMVKSSRAFNSINSCPESSKTQFFHMSIISLKKYLKLYLFISQKYLHEFGSRWMSVDRSSVWADRTINDCYVHCFP